MTNIMNDNLRGENLDPGAGGTPPTDAEAQAAAAAEAGVEGGAEKLPWHKDPRFLEFQKSKKELDDRLATMRRQDLEAGERREIESVTSDFPIPEEMPLPTKEDYEAADFSESQAAVMSKMVNAAVHNDRRKMALSYAEAQKRNKEQQIQGDRKRREVLLEAENDFGNKEFGSLADIRSPIRQRAEVILRANPQYQTSPIGIYRACKDAYEELSKAADPPGRLTGEEILSGRQAGGATLPGPRPGFKHVDPKVYNTWKPDKQEAYDRASLGLPPEE